MYKPFHLIGLELSISVLSAALRNEPTGQSLEMRGTVASIAKRDLSAGDVLDGEGGYTVWGQALPLNVAQNALPIGLAHGVRLKRNISAGLQITINDVELGTDIATQFYKELIERVE
jgi:predicted homoserine dehydrogenase-like protein